MRTVWKMLSNISFKFCNGVGPESALYLSAWSGWIIVIRNATGFISGWSATGKKRWMNFARYSQMDSTIRLASQG